MTRAAAFVLLVILSSGVSAALLPGDAVKGKELHNRDCVACHDNRVYTRAHRSVKSIEGLMGRVRLCNQQLGGKLDRDQISDIVKHLNDAYYRFP